MPGRQRVRSRVRVQIRRCPHCNGTVDGHEPGCPQGHLAALLERRNNIECPCCFRRAVELNQSDFYECRECNTQFSTTEAGMKPGLKKELLLVSGKPVSVLVMEEKGDGKFPNDEAIVKAEQRLEQARQQ